MIARLACSFGVVICCVLGGWGARSALAAGPTGPRAATAFADTAAGPSAGALRRPANVDAEDIRDIHGPRSLPKSRSGWWYVAAAALLGAVAAVLAVRSRRREPILPPHERALRALGGARVLVGGDAREFSFVASETIRVYMEEAFHLRAAHRTTEELLSDLMSDTSPVAAHRAKLGEFLRYCDLAKFGAWSLSRPDMEAMLASAEAFIRATAAPPPSNHVPAFALPARGAA